MLVLSRKSGEEIRIGDNIRIVINRVGPNRVSVGIDAPSDVRITRGELETFSVPPPRKSQPAASRRVGMPSEPRRVPTPSSRSQTGALSLPR